MLDEFYPDDSFYDVADDTGQTNRPVFFFFASCLFPFL
jgi:hypothetical protein